jgi:hypothetical protein
MKMVYPLLSPQNRGGSDLPTPEKNKFQLSVEEHGKETYRVSFFKKIYN